MSRSLGWLGLLAWVALIVTACGDTASEKDPLILVPDEDVWDGNNDGGGNNGGGNNGGYGYNNNPGGDVGVDVPPQTCDAANPCSGTEVCRGGFCEPECDAVNACADPLICRNAACVPECDDATPCASPLVCRAMRCEFECEADADCAGTEICAANQCVEPECVTDADCDDPLAQVCEHNLCEAQPCGLHTFTFNPTLPLYSGRLGGVTIGSVHVAGSFNAGVGGQWPATIAAGGLAMTRLDSGEWYAKFPLDNGNYQYKFVVNEGAAWVEDDNTSTIDDTFGGVNSVIDVMCGGDTNNTQSGLCGDVELFDWRDTVMYFLLVDRFFDSDGIADQVANASGGDAANGPSGQYEGGDLAGVTEKLPYLADLGVTALWLSAPYNNRDVAGAAIDTNADSHLYSGYHGYWPSPGNVDYSNPNAPSPRPAVESRIGTDADLHEVIDTAHAIDSADGHGMKVLFDYVMNHVDSESGLYQAHRDWFTSDNGNIPLCPPNRWDDPYWGTRCAFTTYLPAFDFYQDGPRNWSIDDAMWWAREYGIDGYRLDAIKHVPIQWLTQLRSRLNTEFTDAQGGRFYLVGETFDYFNRDLLKSFVDPATKLDGQFDFPLKANVCRTVFSREQPMQDFANWMGGNDTFYGPSALMTTWIGNHDIPRAIHFASGQIGNCTQGSDTGNAWTSNFGQPQDNVPYERLGLAFAILMTNPGIPLIYYGDEVGLAGGGDPDNRRMMPWDGQTATLNVNQRALRSKVQKLAHLRAENKVITRGRRQTLSSSQDTWVYRMSGCADASPDVIVALNRADGAQSVDIPAGSYTDLLTNQPASGGSVSVGPRSFLVYRVR